MPERRAFSATKPTKSIGQHITRLIPPELQDEESVIISKLRAGERIDHYETVRVAKDGRRLDISLTVSPMRAANGEIIGASKVARDITDKKQTEKLQQLLVEELNHRVKNTLATVQAIATQSLVRAKSQKDFVTSFSGRLQALAKLHTLLTQTNMRGTDLSELIASQVRLGSPDEDRVSINGPFLFLGPQEANHLGMVLHELTTNARKYGALSADGRTPRGELGSPNQWRPQVADAMDGKQRAESARARLARLRHDADRADGARAWRRSVDALRRGRSEMPDRLAAGRRTARNGLDGDDAVRRLVDRARHALARH